VGRAVLILNNNASRAKAINWVDRAPAGTRLTFQGPRRSTPQNDRLWALLTDIATQKLWHGIRLEPADWKTLFMSALNRELRLAPNLDGTGFVNLGTSSSALSKAEFSELFEVIHAWAAREGVIFSEPTTVSSTEGTGAVKAASAVDA